MSWKTSFQQRSIHVEHLEVPDKTVLYKPLSMRICVNSVNCWRLLFKRVELKKRDLSPGPCQRLEQWLCKIKENTAATAEGMLWQLAPPLASFGKCHSVSMIICWRETLMKGMFASFTFFSELYALKSICYRYNKKLNRFGLIFDNIQQNCP